MRFTITRIDNRKLIVYLTLAICFTGWLPIRSIAWGESTQNSHQGKGKSSLIEIAPALYKSAKRYPKFYGDENTTHGNILERSDLFGNPGGVRDYLVDHGFYFDFGATQFLQSNVSGGDQTTPSARVNGSTDGWLWFDTGKAGLWPNGAAFLHGEGSWNASTSINSDVGSMLPANQDATMPDPDGSNWALSELYLLQALPGNLLAVAGKMDMAAWADANTFANNERTQFQYTGLINNAIIGSFVPYTALAAWLAWTPTKEHFLYGIFSQTDGAATVTGFDTLFNGNNTFAVEYKFSPTIGNRPGNYHIIGLYTSKEATNFQISDRQLIAEAIGAVPVDEENDNYAFLLNFHQYLWVHDESADAYASRYEKSSFSGLHSHHNSPIGIGIFGRAGWAPKDRNVIDQFYSFGIGGYGMLIPGRDNDNWGIGWAGTHISSDLRDLPVGLRSFEHAGEVFYNFWLTPAAHLSLNTQVIRPADDSLDTAWTLGSRLQLDF
jgi:porin